MASARVKAWCAGMGVVASLTMAGAAQAQSLRDALRDQARAGDFASAFQALSIFGGTPGISAATYNGSEIDLSSYKLPVSQTFAPFGSGPLASVAPYAELTISYLNARQNAYLGDSPNTPHYANLRFNTFTGLAGVGLDIPLGSLTVVRPILLAGYARIDSDTHFQGPNAAVFQAATRGILSDVQIDSILLGGGLMLEHTRELGPESSLTANLRYNQITDINYSASDRSLESTNRFSASTVRVEARGPTGLMMLNYPLRWIAFTGGTWMMGRHRNALGFNTFAELGGGIELADRDLLRGVVEGVSLRGSALVGERVTGWSLGLSLSF
jgi:hypothetical protein